MNNASAALLGLGEINPTSVISTAVKSIIASAPWKTMDRKEFFQARDNKLAELLRHGATHSDSEGCNWTPTGYSFELCQGGFGHSTLPNYVGFDYDHYKKVYQSFLETVYFPVLAKVNPAELERQLRALGINVTNEQPQVAEGTLFSKRNIVIAGSVLVVGVIIVAIVRGD